MLPIAIRVMVTPSDFQKKCSFKMRGDRIAEIIIETQEVEAMSMMFPNFKATAFESYPQPRIKTPSNHSCL